jgi:magnesium-protoporphyrin IX monomethyl ester (oxidative) cyclase
MKILLTTPCRPREIDTPLDLVPPLMPLGIGFIAAFLERNGYEVKIIDNFVYGSNYAFERFLFRRNFLKSLRLFQPDFVGIYVDSVSFQKALELIKLIKDNSKTKIACGGPHASEMPESFPKEVDFIVQGEGEFAFLDILQNRISGQLVKCLRLDEIENLPMPAWHLYDLRRYSLREEMYLPHPPVFNMNTSRGCPFGCKFCSVPAVWGRQYRMFSASKIVNEIEFLVKEYKIKGIYFREDNFTVNKERVDEFCDLLLKRSLKIEWACETRVDTIDAELMGKMKQSGCQGFYVGVESGSQRILDNINKGITVEQIIKFFDSCHKTGIRTKSSFIFGTPQEEEKDRVQTEALINKIKADYVSRGVYVGIPKSEFYNYFLENKLYYYMDRNGFIYPHGYRELAIRYYGKNVKKYIP